MQTPGIEPGRATAPVDSFWTSLRYLAAGRVVLAAVLVLFAFFGDVLSADAAAMAQPLFTSVAIAWLALALVFLAWARARSGGFQLQLFVHALVDLVMLVLLMHAAGGPRSGVGVLMVASVAGAAVLSTARTAAFFAAVATVLLLAETAWRWLASGAPDPAGFVPAALVGTACFTTAALINRLAARLATQEALARERGADLRAQLAITQLVVAELPQGVVVLDRNGAVRTMNRSAQLLLGAAGAGPVLDRVKEARRAGGGAEGEIELAAPAGMPRAAAEPAARLRVRWLSPADAARGDTVLVIEDLRQVEERAQQLKLASMGRLSASIAHEIRNPLAAIRHANSLLGERLSEPTQARLARIVEDNSVRIDRIVSNVLSIARRERTALEPVDVRKFLETLLPDVLAGAGADPRRVEVAIGTDAPLRFDANHLRQVVVNLLTNALRYASAAPGAVRLSWGRGANDRLEFRVADDGPGLAPEMLEHVFEPFFTTEARGTGLGLFLARELCGANQASLRYEPAAEGARHRGAFVILPLEAAAPA